MNYTLLDRVSLTLNNLLWWKTGITFTTLNLIIQFIARFLFLLCVLSFFQVSVRYLHLFMSWWPTSLCPPVPVSRTTKPEPVLEFNWSPFWDRGGGGHPWAKNKGELHLWSQDVKTQHVCVLSASATGLLTWCIIAVMKGSRMYRQLWTSVFILDRSLQIRFAVTVYLGHLGQWCKRI